MRTLHITNGDGAAGLLKSSAVPGDVLPWRDPMHHGPFPAGLSLEALRPVRARYLAGQGGDMEAVEREFRLRDEALCAAPGYDRVVLWFEHDLLDQLQILQLLDWFAAAGRSRPEPEIICIDRFAGMDRFRGLGELDPVQIASLFDTRVPVTGDMLTQAQAGWGAFRSASPMDLVAFLTRDLSRLPFLKQALLRHLEEFPSAESGLSRTEQQLLSLVARGVHGPVELFVQNMDLETALYIGDWRTFSVIDGLCRAGLLSCDTGGFRYPPLSRDTREGFRAQRLGLTDLGRAVEAGEAGMRGRMHRDAWLGGVHVQSGRNAWTWDAARGAPVLRML